MLGECPSSFAYGQPDWLPHAGLWERPAHGEGCVCREHGLEPDEHGALSIH